MRKLLTLLLAILMFVSLIAGCSGETETPKESPSKPPATTQPTKGPENKEDSEDNEGFKLPIVDEPMTFEMFAMVFMAENMVDLNDGYAFQELARRTNINFEWVIPSLAAGMETFNLMLTSNDLTDAIQVYGMGMWVGGLDANVDEGFILDITDMIKGYMPNYTLTREADPKIMRDTTTDMGRVVALRPIYESRQPVYEGPVVRQDLLNKAGYNGELVTVDDWYNALKALKGVVEEEPFYLVNRDFLGLDYHLAAAFDVAGTQNGFIQVNNRVQYSYISDGMRDYLSTLSKWYDEGLVDKDFFSRSNNMRADYTDILDDGHALFQSVFTYIDQYEKSALTEGFELTPIRTPVRAKGNKIHIFTLGPTIGSGVTTISPTCHDPEILLQLFDYLYTEEGALLYNYGVEGQGHTIVNGKPMLTELVVNNPDGIGMSQALSLYCFPAPFPGAYDWRREFTNYMSEKSINANFLWSEDKDFAYELSDTVTMTSDEVREYSAIFNDIKTYVIEQIPRFITGDRSVAEEWDDFVNEVKGMNIDKCIEYWQNAYDRYLAR